MKPFIHLNSAMTVDGKIATENSSLKISGKKDLIRVHKLREKYDAIMVGINTVIVDNPKLTIHKIKANKEDNPTRIVIDSKARTPRDSEVLNDDAKTIIIVSEKAEEYKIKLLEEKCDVIICGENRVDLPSSMKILYEMGLTSILLEGGSTLNFSMFEEELIDEVSICIGSKILGGYKSKTFVDGTGFDKNNCVNLELKNIEKIDDNDVVISYNVCH